MEKANLLVKTEVRALAGFKWEGHKWSENEDEIVRYYRDPEDRGSRECGDCEKVMHEHGWIDHGDHGHVVCPGDYVVYVEGVCHAGESDDFTARTNALPVKAILVEAGIFQVEGGQ